MAKQEFTPTTEVLQFAFESLKEEIEKIRALAVAVLHRLEPQDPDHPEEVENLISWRLAQALEERTDDADFINRMRELLLGDKTPSTT